MSSNMPQSPRMTWRQSSYDLRELIPNIMMRYVRHSCIHLCFTNGFFNPVLVSSLKKAWDHLQWSCEALCSLCRLRLWAFWHDRCLLLVDFDLEQITGFDWITDKKCAVCRETMFTLSEHLISSTLFWWINGISFFVCDCLVIRHLIFVLWFGTNLFTEERKSIQKQVLYAVVDLPQNYIWQTRLSYSFVTFLHVCDTTY